MRDDAGTISLPIFMVTHFYSKKANQRDKPIESEFAPVFY
jgi:hypothetical protein